MHLTKWSVSFKANLVSYLEPFPNNDAKGKNKYYQFSG